MSPRSTATALAAGLCALLLAAAAAPGCVISPGIGLGVGVSVPPPAPAYGCDIGARTWQQSSPGPCPVSSWRFLPNQDGSWQASETGCGNGTGVAHYDGQWIVVDFQYTGGTGRYTWPLDGQCRSGPGGQVMWSAGALAGQTAPSTLAMTY
jgi:hypothetical protein